MLKSFFSAPPHPLSQQVQVKSNTQSGGPFSLLVRDPSNHILSIQENKKFADNMASSLAREPPSTRPDFKFTVSVPRADNYFPVMRYKCGSELRPVPIVSVPPPTALLFLSPSSSPLRCFSCVVV